MNMKDSGLLAAILHRIDQRGFVQTASGTAPIQPVTLPYVTLNMDPSNVNYAINTLGPTISTRDTKVYFKRFKTIGFCQNHSNITQWMQVTPYRCRGRVESADYPTITSILSDQTFPSSDPWVPVTTSATAQRLLRFGRTYYVRIRPGECYKYSVDSKYRVPILVTEEIEASSIYIMSKYTKGLIFKPYPILLPYGGGATYASTSYEFSFHEMHYLSFYQMGYNNPGAFNAGVTISTGTAQGRIYNDAIAQTQSIA